MSEGQIVFLDVESSGLHATSYPIEIGWAFPEPGLPAAAVLIKPHRLWKRDDWDMSVTDLHALDWDYCDDEGIPAPEVAQRLNAVFAGKAVFSDAVGADTFWIDRLFDAVGVARMFSLEPAETAFRAVYGDVDDTEGLYASVSSVIDVVHPVLHRAEPDAKRLAAIHLAATSIEFRDHLAESIVASSRND